MIYDVQSGVLDSLAPVYGLKYEWMADSTILVKQRNVRREKGTTIVDELFLKYFLNGTVDTAFSVTTTKSSYERYIIRKLNDGKFCISHNGYSSPDSLKSMIGDKSLDSNLYYVVSNYDYWQTRQSGQERDNDVWLIRYDGHPYKRVTTGKSYRMPQLSPDGQKISCVAGRGLDVINLDGEVICHYDHTDMESWLSDSEGLVFVKATEKDDDIVASDIYMADLKSKDEIQITNTPDKIELSPAVSPDRTKLAYISYEADANYVEIRNIEL